MIEGVVTAEGVPVVLVTLAGNSWSAIIDTGFNGDLELPTALQLAVNARFLCRNRSLLAAGQVVEEDCYLVEFPFDGQTRLVEATFVTQDELLIGTHLLREYRLEIDFRAGTVRIGREDRANGPPDV